MTGDEMLAELQSGHPRFEWVAQQIQEDPSGLNKTCAAVYGDTDTIQVCVYAWKTHEDKTLFDARVYLKGASSNEDVLKGIGLFCRADDPNGSVSRALSQAHDLLSNWYMDCIQAMTSVVDSVDPNLFPSWPLGMPRDIKALDGEA